MPATCPRVELLPHGSTDRDCRVNPAFRPQFTTPRRDPQSWMIEFKVLGSLSLTNHDGQEATSLLVRSKQVALLAYLAARQPRGWQQRNSLLALLWPESDDKRARFSLRSALHGIRSELGTDTIIARGDEELAINPDAIRCDVSAFEDALDAGRLEDALAMYRGPLLEGLVVPGLADFHIWADERREGLRRRAVAAAVSLADTAAGTDAELRWTRRALELSPHEEALLRRALQALARRGERAEALRVYEQWAARLRTELDGEPSPETSAMVERLRAAPPAPPRVTTRAESTIESPAVDAGAPATVPAPAAKRTRRRVLVGVGAVIIGSVMLISSLQRRAATQTLDTPGTSSPAAAQAFADGERELSAARYAGAIDAYARAVAADSTFARGFFRLSYAAAMGAHDSLSRVAADRALALKAALSPGDRLLLDAWRASLDSRIQESVSLYEKALNQDASNAEAWLQLAEIRYHWGPMLGTPPARAADAFRRVIALRPDNGAALIHLARLEARDAPHGGGFDTLVAAARRLKLSPAEDLELRTLAAAISGNARDRDSVLAEAAARGAVTERQLLTLALPFPDTAIAAALLRDLTKSDVRPRLRVIGYVELAHLAASRGRVRDALRAVDSLAIIAPERAVEVRAWIYALPFVKTPPGELLRIRDALARMPESHRPIGPSVSQIAEPGIYGPRRRYLAGILSLIAGDTATALRASHDLASWSGPDSQDSAFAADYAQSIRAELRIATSPSEAAETFSAPHSEPDRTYPDIMSFFAARERYLRAEALAAGGRRAEAIGWLETFPDPTGYDVWFLAPSLARRAELYRATGRNREARQAYERFLALWSHADPELGPMVAGARAALDKLPQ